jgi:serine protease Do
VLVSGISQGSDAFAAGIRQYDILVSFNNTTIEDATHFMRLLADAQIGGSVSLGIFRSGRTFTAKVPIVQSTSARSRRR